MLESWSDVSEQTLIFCLACFMVVSGFFTIVMLMWGFKAMYGRYSIESKILIPSRICWVLQEAPAFFIGLHYLSGCKNVVNYVILLLFVAHYFMRTFIFPYLMKTNKSTPWYIFLMAFLFCCWNGYMQGSYHSKYAEYPPDHLWKPLPQLGFMLFFIGFLINQHSDNILRSLRKPGETAYKIPVGGMFTFVSGANFFGEIVEWIGFACIAQSLPAIAFSFFTLANIGPRAIQHHEWYLTKFENYPKSRKALIPFIL